MKDGKTMKQILIEDLKPELVSGIAIGLPGSAATAREGYFEWTASSLTAEFKTGRVSGGILKAWKHEPIFDEVETHIDAETFYFLRGSALMLFADVSGGRPDMDSVQIVRIRPGTQLVIQAGKAHFPAVAEGDEPVEAVVVSPRMEAPRMRLTESVLGVQSA
jgi:hypothetical protein